MFNPFTGTYSALVKSGVVLVILISLYGTHKFKVNEAVREAVYATELKHKDEVLAQKEVLFIKKRAAEKELEKDFTKRQGEYNEKIKSLAASRDSLLASLQPRPARPISGSDNGASANTAESTRGAYPSQLFREDAAAFINFARDSEEIRLGLIQCYSDYESVKLSVESFNRK